MPPAFNLSQDQTLQFDLEFAQNGIEVNFTSVFRERFRSEDLESCDSWHSPSNAHAYRLYVVKELCLAAFADLLSSAEKEDYDLISNSVSSTRLLFLLASLCIAG